MKKNEVLSVKPSTGEEWFVVYRGIPGPQVVECALIEEMTQHTVVLRRVADVGALDQGRTWAARYLIREVRFVEKVP